MRVWARGGCGRGRGGLRGAAGSDRADRHRPAARLLSALRGRPVGRTRPCRRQAGRPRLARPGAGPAPRSAGATAAARPVDPDRHGALGDGAVAGPLPGSAPPVGPASRAPGGSWAPGPRAALPPGARSPGIRSAGRRRRRTRILRRPRPAPPAAPVSPGRRCRPRTPGGPARRRSRSGGRRRLPGGCGFGAVGPSGSSSRKTGPVSSTGMWAGPDGCAGAAGPGADGRAVRGPLRPASRAPTRRAEARDGWCPAPRRRRSSTGHIREWTGPGNTPRGACRHRGPGLGRSCPWSRICFGGFKSTGPHLPDSAYPRAGPGPFGTTFRWTP